MPIVGNLSEFPLPEVLLLIGNRTGRLRLLDVPEFGVLDVDISGGEVQTMHMGGAAVHETTAMLDKLSAIVHTQAGMFEFRLGPVSLAARGQPLSTHDLALKLVCHVDEQASQAPGTTPEQMHRLVIPQPEIWVEPDLNQFFHEARALLTSGVSQDELAQKLGIDPGLVYKHLNHLRMLGLTELLDSEAPPPAQEEPTQQEEILRKSTVFIQTQTAHIRDRIRKLSSG
jgi:hypothetical protein